MTTEPRVEELLATIRKAIDRDISELDRRAPAAGSIPARGALRELRVSGGPVVQAGGPDADEDIAKLRDRVMKQRQNDRETAAARTYAAPLPQLEPRSGGFSSILSRPQPLPEQALYAPHLSGSYVEEVQPMQPAPQNYYNPAQHENAWVRASAAPEQTYLPAPQAEPLLSVDAAYAAQDSFQALANSLLMQMGGEGRVEEMSRELLRPMLKQWLDDNLPPLVERLVRDEIERVARRGR